MASETTLPAVRGIFEIERQDDAIIVIPVMDLRELDYQRIEAGAQAVLELLNSAEMKNVIMDFYRTDYYGSTALGFFLKLWKRTKSLGGRMAFCNVSEHEKEILHITNLDRFWPICASRKEALAAVQG